MTSAATRALADVAPVPYWLDSVAAPAPSAPLDGHVDADLAVVGGGYTGLWTALQAKETDPSLEVVVLEARRVGGAASGRNGGFCSSSLTHGLANGAARFPDEIGRLERLGRENLDAIEDTLRRHGIDCGWERTGEVTAATAPWQVRALAEAAELSARHGGHAKVLDREAVRDLVDSPTYVGGLLDADSVAMVDPARLAWGLAAACRAAGVRLHEGTEVRGIADAAPALRLRTPQGSVRAPRVALGTNGFPPLLRRLRSYVVPVYDHALVSEPLSPQQRSAIGWQGREGMSDAGNLFHYYRLTDDGRILWGGYDALYHFGSKVADRLDDSPATSARLAEHFLTTFPQLEGLRFTHSWGGVIDTCTRFCVFWGRAFGGRLAYATGYTGLGVGASRFGARVMLDLLGGTETELTRLRMVRTKPLPFPPEPLRWAGIELTKRASARADATGRRGPWLRTLDRVGMGFDT